MKVYLMQLTCLETDCFIQPGISFSIEVKTFREDLFSMEAMFETNKIKKMYDISELYPAKLIKQLGINLERYPVKLADSEKFTVSEVLPLAYKLNVDPNLIIDVIHLKRKRRSRLGLIYIKPNIPNSKKMLFGR